MAVPDVTTLTEAELQETIRAASERLSNLQNTEQENRDRLLDPTRVQGEIDVMVAMVRDLQAWIETAPSGAQKQMAIMLRRTAMNTVRLMRVTAGILTSDDVGNAV